MTDQIVMKERIRLVAMNSIATDLEKWWMKNIVKDTSTMFETDNRSVWCSLYPFSDDRSKKIGWDHAKALMIKEK